MTGLLPGYATLGLAAPIILVCLRTIQGIGLGGEFGGASSLLAEFGSQRRHPAFWMSLANLGIPGGAMLASAVLLMLSGNFATVGWRIATLLSAVIVIPALLARYKLTDFPLFERLKRQDRLARLPSFDVVRAYARPIVLLALVSAFQQMDGYVSGTYVISFMHSAGIPLSMAAIVIFISRIGDIGGVALSGPAADFFKRKVVAYVAIVATTLLSVPFVVAILNKQLMLIIVLQFLITFFGIGLLHELRSDSHVGELSDEIPILGNRNFLQPFCDIGRDDSAVATGWIDRSGCCRQVVLCTDHLWDLLCDCDGVAAIHQRDAGHRSGTAR